VATPYRGGGARVHHIFRGAFGRAFVSPDTFHYLHTRMFVRQSVTRPRSGLDVLQLERILRCACPRLPCQILVLTRAQHTTARAPPFLSAAVGKYSDGQVKKTRVQPQLRSEKSGAAEGQHLRAQSWRIATWAQPLRERLQLCCGRFFGIALDMFLVGEPTVATSCRDIPRSPGR